MGDVAAWDAPVEGVPLWLCESLFTWLETHLDLWDKKRREPRADVLRTLERVLRIRLQWASYRPTADTYESMERLFRRKTEHFLDAIDYALRVTAGRGADELELMLAEGGSAWSVGPDNLSLSRRVPEESADTARALAAEGGRAGKLLAAAWRDVYGRDPNPSSGYREAVRAIEAAVCHVIIPNDSVPTLGKAISALRCAPPGKYTTVFPENAVGGNPLEAVRRLMELVWTGQLDRHGTADESVPLAVTQEQAEAAVQAALPLLMWFQRGFVKLATP